MAAGEPGDGGIPVKEYGARTLDAARLYSLLRQETGIEDPWHILVLAVCAFERLHVKDGWQFVLLNRRDIEEVGRLYETSGTPQEFQEGLISLKEHHLRERMDRGYTDLK